MIYGSGSGSFCGVSVGPESPLGVLRRRVSGRRFPGFGVTVSRPEGQLGPVDRRETHVSGCYFLVGPCVGYSRDRTGLPSNLRRRVSFTLSALGNNELLKFCTINLLYLKGDTFTTSDSPTTLTRVPGRRTDTGVEVCSVSADVVSPRRVRRQSWCLVASFGPRTRQPWSTRSLHLPISDHPYSTGVVPLLLSHGPVSSRLGSSSRCRPRIRGTMTPCSRSYVARVPTLTFGSLLLPGGSWCDLGDKVSVGRLCCPRGLRLRPSSVTSHVEGSHTGRRVDNPSLCPLSPLPQVPPSSLTSEF